MEGWNYRQARQKIMRYLVLNYSNKLWGNCCHEVVTQTKQNCVWAFRSFSDISVSRCCFSEFGSCWRWDNISSNADSHWCFLLEGCGVLFFLTFQMKCPWNVNKCDSVMKRIYSRPAWNVYERTMTSKERRKDSRQSCKWVKIEDLFIKIEFSITIII